MTHSHLAPLGLTARESAKLQASIPGLHSWYRARGRDLPWRHTSDPYAIWISEVMLQQTRVTAVVPYYHRWLDRFPTVGALAAAPLEEVLKLWEGLGYYSRARNLHRAARAVVDDWGGSIPADPAAFADLPGVGTYTTAAVMSIAFGADLAVMDGNVRRVLCRLLALEADPRRAPHAAALDRLAQDLLPPGTAADHNQAMMELGATLCTPRNPTCQTCPVANVCRGLARGTPERYPLRKSKHSGAPPRRGDRHRPRPRSGIHRPSPLRWPARRAMGVSGREGGTRRDRGAGPAPGTGRGVRPAGEGGPGAGTGGPRLLPLQGDPAPEAVHLPGPGLPSRRGEPLEVGGPSGTGGSPHAPCQPQGAGAVAGKLGDRRGAPPMISSRGIHNAVLALAVAVLTLLLFMGGPGGDWPRSLRHLWDLGHVLLFGLAALAALRWGAARWPLPLQVGAILGGALVLGAATEWLQRGTNRSASLGDLQRDVIGAALALAFASPVVADLPRWRRTAVRAAVLLTLAWQLAPVLRATVDELAARRDFPVLAGLERPFELERWRGSATFRIVETPVRAGRRSLRVDLGTDTYSGVSLAEFPGDWARQRSLAFSVFNPDPDPLELVCKVNDREHRRRGYPYRDRFNRRLTVSPGWNDFEIPLEEIRAAPEDREMDLTRVVTLQWFAVRLPAPRAIYLDQVELR